MGDRVTEKDKKSVEAMAQAIVNKLLHQPIAALRAGALKRGPQADELFRAVWELFPIEPDDDGGEADAARALAVAEEAEALEVDNVVPINGDDGDDDGDKKGPRRKGGKG
jgi:hypothetical protein